MFPDSRKLKRKLVLISTAKWQINPDGSYFSRSAKLSNTLMQCITIHIGLKKVIQSFNPNHNLFNNLLGISCQIYSTFADRPSIRRQFLTDIQQAAEDELFCVLNIFLFSWGRILTPIAHKLNSIHNPLYFYVTYFSLMLNVKHSSRCKLNIPREQIKQSGHKTLGSP